MNNNNNNNNKTAEFFRLGGLQLSHATVLHHDCFN